MGNALPDFRGKFLSAKKKNKAEYTATVTVCKRAGKVIVRLPVTTEAKKVLTAIILPELKKTQVFHRGA